MKSHMYVLSALAQYKSHGVWNEIKLLAYLELEENKNKFTSKLS